MFNSYFDKITSLSLLVAVFLLASCTEDSNSIFDPDHDFEEADPVVSQVIPENSAFAGVGSVTPEGMQPVVITGQNFGTDPSNIIVYFGSNRAEIESLQDDEIQVTPPNDPGAERRIRVVKPTAEKYSEYPEDPEENYELRSIFTPFPGFEDADEPRSITTGFNGELFAMNVLSGINNGIISMDREGDREQISAKEENWVYTKIQHGPDGMIYAVRGGAVGVIYRLDPDEGLALGEDEGVTPETYIRLSRGFGGVQDVEFDQDGYLWACGSDKLLRVDVETGDTEEFTLDGDIRTLRAYNGNLYAGIVRSDVSGVWRVPILGDNTPGEAELYVEMPSTDVRVRSMAFTAGGDLVMATNTIESLMIYRNNQLEELYPDIVHPGASDLAVSSTDNEQLLVNIIGTTIDGVTSQTEILMLEMAQEMAPINGTF